MIEITSLLLGFILGTHPVELVVDGPVARVEVLLDGAVAAQLGGPPWTTTVDFGDELLPHRLEALAYAASGHLLDRAARLVNVSRSDYGVTLALEPSGPAGRRAGRLRWTAVLGQDPAAVELLFDGRRVRVDGAGRFLLPQHDAASTHHLEAVAVFPDGGRARTALTFGGLFGERVTSALTALAMTTDGITAGHTWTREDLADAFLRDGESVPTFAVGGGEAKVVLVRDEALAAPSRRLRKLLRRLGDAPAPSAMGFRAVAISPRPVARHTATFQLVDLGAVGRYPFPEPWLGEGFFRRDRRRKRSALWDAVALAGRDAASSRGPRAVLLLVDDAPRDASRVDLAGALRYVERLRVPLFVWAPEASKLEVLGLDTGERIAVGPEGLSRLVERLGAELEAQTVVWLQGEHLPQEITLSDEAPKGLLLP